MAPRFILNKILFLTKIKKKPLIKLSLHKIPENIIIKIYRQLILIILINIKINNILNLINGFQN